jgi:hypothetical protein
MGDTKIRIKLLPGKLKTYKGDSGIDGGRGGGLKAY